MPRLSDFVRPCVLGGDDLLPKLKRLRHFISGAFSFYGRLCSVIRPPSYTPPSPPHGAAALPRLVGAGRRLCKAQAASRSEAAAAAPEAGRL